MDVLRDMLPEGNQIADSVYEAKKIICPLGIEVEKIHACKNNCILFCGDNVDLDKCPKCGYDRYKRKKDGGDDNNANYENEPYKIRGKKKKANRGAPVRVAWYFCIIPWLKRWFTTRKEAQLLRWHEKGPKELKKDGKFGHPADAPQWGNINNHFPWFDDARSIRFAMSTDGVNPFGNQSSTHRTWPIVLSLYNLPP
jgi:Zn ribbon nucleic-acid-binding protein